MLKRPERKAKAKPKAKAQEKKPVPVPGLHDQPGGSWYLLANENCTCKCTYSHIRGLKGPL